MISAFFLWFSIARAITLSDSSTWLVPMIWISIFIVSICLGIILSQDMLLFELVLMAACLLSLIFAPHLFQMGAIILGVYFLFLASRRIRRDMELNVQISIWKSLQAGKSYLLLGLVVIISMQYFLMVDKKGGEVGVPKFDLTPMVKQIILPMAATFNPAMENVNDQTLTVDEFFVLSQQDNSSDEITDSMLETQIPEGATLEQRDMFKNQIREKIIQSQGQISERTEKLMLDSFHSQLSEVAGYQIIGNEKISDVYAGLIAQKLDKFLQYPVNVAGQTTSAYPIILTIVLILTIYPLGSMLSIVWFLLVKLLFHFLVRYKIVNIEKVTVQKEMLV